MNRQDFVAKVAEKAQITKEQADAAVRAYGDVIIETLKKEEKVQLMGFGTYESFEKKQRVGRNPQTNEEIIIPKSNKPKFKPGKAFIDALN